MEERRFQVFCWLGLLLCDFINDTHHLINAHLTTLLLLLTRHVPNSSSSVHWGSSQFEPNAHEGNTGCGCVLSMNSACGGFRKRPIPPKTCWCSSANQPLHARVCHVSHLVVFSYLQKECCVSAVLRKCYLRSLDPAPPSSSVSGPHSQVILPQHPTSSFPDFECVIGHGLL